MAGPARRRFAPLGATGGLGPTLRGIVFDMDGTLCKPQNHMFAEMRHALDIPPQTDILHHIDRLPPAAQPAAHAAIRAIERRAMASQTPQPGLLALMRYLDARGLPKAICTRNFDLPVRHLLDTFLGGDADADADELAKGTVFHPIVTREFRPPKPHPAGILHIATTWRLPDAGALIMVGDSADDMLAGRRAGAATVLLLNEENGGLADEECTDLAIRRLDELVGILENGFEGREVRARTWADGGGPVNGAGG